MVELYIEGKKVDLKTDVKVALNFTNTEVEYPTVIKNSFSTTVKVEGTKTNNEIFGDIWKLDRVIGGNSTIPISTNFDATKRVNFQLIDNGDVIEDGYLQLTNINYTKGMIEYSLVLYGGLGDFFYTLSYGDTDNEKTLEDLHFGWRDTLEEEKTDVLGNWNRDFISTCWTRLENNTIRMGELESDISPIPTYNGLYEDFDNNKCMVDMTSGYVPYLQTEYKNNNKTYKLFDDKYGLVEMPRELVEWEIKDLRSNQQRFGLRMSTFLNAVSNPENNGGFNVVLDDEIKDSPYYRKAYIMFGKPNFEMDDIEQDYEDPVILNPFSMNFQRDDFDKSTTFSPSQIELTNLGIPNVRLNMHIDFEFGSLGFMSQDARNNWETRVENAESGFLETDYQFFWTGLLFRVEAYSTSGAYIGSTPSILYSNNGVDGKDDRCYNRKWGSTDYGNFQNESLNQLMNALNNESEFRSKPITEIIYQNYDKIGSSSYPLDFNQNLPFIGQPAVLRMSAYWVYSQIDQHITGGGVNSETYKGGFMKYDGNHYINYGDQWFDSTYIYEAKERGGRARSLTFNVLSGQVTKSGQVKSLVFPITKKKLFGGTKSPYKYLVDFTKMLGLKYRYDRYTRTIHIEKRRNYYTGEVKNLNVDLTKGISITPTTAQSKWYSLELETPESYASLLYNKTNAVTYGNKLLGVDYEFNNDNTNLVEGNIYKNILPYRLVSYYFKPNAGIPSFFLSPTIKYSLYNEEEGLYTVEISNQWNQIKFDYGTSYRDTSTRMCMFNTDNKYMSDIDNSLVFINGFERNKNFIISDNMKEMFDMNEKPCYLFTMDPKIAIQNPSIPVFTKYSENEIENVGSFDASFDFTVPNQIFGYDGVRYNENSTIYHAYWKNYLGDLYDKNTKLVTLNAFLQNNPIEEMRDFYYFDGCYWAISKIFDYVIGGYEPTKVELVKVNDTKNYKDEYNTPVYVINLRVEPNRPYIIPASGGFISPETLNIPVRAYYSDGTSRVVNDYNITGNTVYGENLGKEITPMREIGTINFTVTYGGVSSSGTVPVMQEANERTETSTTEKTETDRVTHKETQEIELVGFNRKIIGINGQPPQGAGTNIILDSPAGYFDIEYYTYRQTDYYDYEYDTWKETEIQTTGYLWTSGASEIITETIKEGEEQVGPKKLVGTRHSEPENVQSYAKFDGSIILREEVLSTVDYVNTSRFYYSENTSENERSFNVGFYNDYSPNLDIASRIWFRQLAPGKKTYYMEFSTSAANEIKNMYILERDVLTAKLKCKEDDTFSLNLTFDNFTKTTTHNITFKEVGFNLEVRFNKIGFQTFILIWDWNTLLSRYGLTGDYEGGAATTFRYMISEFSSGEQGEGAIITYGDILVIGDKTGANQSTGYYEYGRIYQGNNAPEKIRIPASHYQSNDIVDNAYLYVSTHIENLSNVELDRDMFSADMSGLVIGGGSGARELSLFLSSMKPRALTYEITTFESTTSPDAGKTIENPENHGGNFYVVYEMKDVKQLLLEYLVSADMSTMKKVLIDYTMTVANDTDTKEVNYCLWGEEGDGGQTPQPGEDTTSKMYIGDIIELVGRGTDTYDYGHFYRNPYYENYITIPMSHYKSDINVDKLYIYVEHYSGYDTSLTNTQFTVDLHDMLTHKYNDTVATKFSQPITASYLSLGLNTPLKKELTYSEISSYNRWFYAVYEFNASEKNFILSVVSKYQDIAEVNSVKFPITFTIPGMGTYSADFTYEGKIREGEPNIIS